MHLRISTCQSAALLLAVSMVLAGCTKSAWTRRWSYNNPPATATTAWEPDRQVDQGKPIVVVGHFSNPRRPSVRWRDIGAGMGEAVGRALMEDGSLEVWVDPALSHSISRLLQSTRKTRREQIATIRSDYPAIDFIVVGEVTDFHHSSVLPDDLTRRKLIFGKKNEAIVAISFSVLDLASGRMIAADHIIGTAGAGKDDIRSYYRELSFGSYLFWSTPLGEASETAVERTVSQLRDIVPRFIGEIRVARQTAVRRVEIAAGKNARLATGQEYYVYHIDESGTTSGVRDPDTNEGLRVRIDRVYNDAATGWLIGQKPVDIDLTGAILRSDLHADVPTS